MCSPQYYYHVISNPASSGEKSAVDNAKQKQISCGERNDSYQCRRQFFLSKPGLPSATPGFEASSLYGTNRSVCVASTLSKLPGLSVKPIAMPRAIKRRQRMPALDITCRTSPLVCPSTDPATWFSVPRLSFVLRLSPPASSRPAFVWQCRPPCRRNRFSSRWP